MPKSKTTTESASVQLLIVSIFMMYKISLILKPRTILSRATYKVQLKCCSLPSCLLCQFRITFQIESTANRCRAETPALSSLYFWHFFEGFYQKGLWATPASNRPLCIVRTLQCFILDYWSPRFPLTPSQALRGKDSKYHEKPTTFLLSPNRGYNHNNLP